MKNNILFICRHNAFRSKYAEAIFKKLNKNKSFKAKSAGIIRSEKTNPIQRRVGRRLGINIKGVPKSLSVKLLKWADIIVITADDVPVSIFKGVKKRGKRLILWKIPDAPPDSPNINEQDIERVIKLIMKKIKGLIINLK